jgi:hypothetical protein
MNPIKKKAMDLDENELISNKLGFDDKENEIYIKILNHLKVKTLKDWKEFAEEEKNKETIEKIISEPFLIKLNSFLIVLK